MDKKIEKVMAVILLINYIALIIELGRIISNN